MNSCSRPAIQHFLLFSFVTFACVTLFAEQAAAQAQASTQDCEQIKKDISALQDDLLKVGASLNATQKAFEIADRGLQDFDNSPTIKKMLQGKTFLLNEDFRGELLENRRQRGLARGRIKSRLEDLKLTVQALKDTIANLLNKLGDCGSKRPEDSKPKPKPSPAPISGAIDSCLVGTWRSESLVSEVGYKGGAGIVLTIKPDGLETIDYNGMKPIEGNGETHLWRGIVEAYFTTSNGTATITKAGKTDLTVKETYRDGRTSETNTKALGLAALGNYPPDRSYTCDGTTLKFKSPLHTATFKREKK